MHVDAQLLVFCIFMPVFLTTTPEAWLISYIFSFSRNYPRCQSVVWTRYHQLEGKQQKPDSGSRPPPRNQSHAASAQRLLQWRNWCKPLWQIPGSGRTDTKNCSQFITICIILIYDSGFFIDEANPPKKYCVNGQLQAEGLYRPASKTHCRCKCCSDFAAACHQLNPANANCHRTLFTIFWFQTLFRTTCFKQETYQHSASVDYQQLYRRNLQTAKHHTIHNYEHISNRYIWSYHICINCYVCLILLTGWPKLSPRPFGLDSWARQKPSKPPAAERRWNRWRSSPMTRRSP